MIIYYSGNPTGHVPQAHLPETISNEALMLTYILSKKKPEKRLLKIFKRRKRK